MGHMLGVKAEEAGWGLKAGWGMAVVLGVGGFLQLARVCNGLVLSVVVFAGLGLFLGEGLMRTRSGAGPRLESATSWQRMKAYVPVIVLLSAIYLLSVNAFYLNDWDDYPAYLPFAKNLLQTGVIDQPFSLRRVLTFGGQQMLQAMLFIHASFRNVDILEMGLSRIIFVGLVAGLVRPQGKKGRWIAGIFLAGLALVPRGPHLPIENVHSEMTGVVLFLTLLRTLWLAAGREKLWRFAAMAAVIGAGVSSMRANYLPAAVFMIAFYYVGSRGDGPGPMEVASGTPAVGGGGVCGGAAALVAGAVSDVGDVAESGVAGQPKSGVHLSVHAVELLCEGAVGAWVCGVADGGLDADGACHVLAAGDAGRAAILAGGTAPWHWRQG